MTRRLRGWEITTLVALVSATLATGVVAALTVPHGLPYDEPAHWSNVLFYAQRRAMPVLGEEGVLYQAQQTPLYYAIAAVIAGATGDPVHGLTAVRLFGVLGAAAVTVLTFFILREAVPRDALVVTAGTGFVALNPMLTVMSASVQNDTWALVAGFGAVLVAMISTRWNGWVAGLAVGALGAAAILTKVSIAPLVLGVIAWSILRRRFRVAALSAVIVVATTAWWFVRNMTLYGDLTGQAGVESAGFEFGRGGLPIDVLARAALTYLTVPTEYLRNVIAAPGWVDIAVLITGVATAAGAVVLVLRRRAIAEEAKLLLLVVVAVSSLAAWLLQVGLGWQVAFRAAYGVIPLVAAAFGAVTLLTRDRLGRLAVAGLLLALLLVLGIWTGAAIVDSSPPSMLQP